MNVDIAERLAKRRREAGYSQESLAEKLGVSRQAVSKWERSESSPDTDNLIALAQLYGVSLDDLLYVDESFKDDVVFEAADRAAGRKTGEAVGSVAAQDGAAAAGAAQSVDAVAAGAAAAGATQASAAQSSASAAYSADEAAASSAEGTAFAGSGSQAPRSEWYVGSDGVFVGDEPARARSSVSFRDGIHIDDGDDYVHISWRDGIHVKEGKKGDEVHVGWDGVHVKEGPRSDGSIPAQDADGNTVDWDHTGVFINGEYYDNWHDANQKFKKDLGMSKSWGRFPFPILAILAYIFIGLTTNEWGYGLFVFFTIPVYYMLGHALYSKRIAHFLEGLYPLGCVVWFLAVGFALNAWHPAWVIFLTIPLVEWAIHSISRWWRRRKGL